MAIYAIGDLHLSFSSDKPMGVFGENWADHHEKIKKNWIESIGKDDTILIPGDVSWALKLNDAIVDLKWLDELPGRKIMCKGNHDYWWPSIRKLNEVAPNMDFIFNSFHVAEGYAICGTRGWVCPPLDCLSSSGAGEDHMELSNELKEDIKIYQRELVRFETSIKQAIQGGNDKIIAMLHYPPTNEKKEISGFVELIERYGIKKVVYGHLHTKLSFESSIIGRFQNADYQLVSCDYLDFCPVRIV